MDLTFVTDRTVGTVEENIDPITYSWFSKEDLDTRVVTLWHEIMEIVLTHPPLARIEFLDGTTRIRSWTDNNGTTTNHLNHYTDGSDTPAWTAENTGVSSDYARNIGGFTGLSATYTSTSGGTITYNLANLHGDLTATTATDGTLTTGDTDTDEYGNPRNPANTGTLRYSWLGTAQRAADTPTGITLMGVRLYNPTTGRFLSVDPIQGASCNPYDYACGDPINNSDLDGRTPKKPNAKDYFPRLFKAEDLCGKDKTCRSAVHWVGMAIWFRNNRDYFLAMTTLTEDANYFYYDQFAAFSKKFQSAYAKAAYWLGKYGIKVYSKLARKGIKMRL